MNSFFALCKTVKHIGDAVIVYGYFRGRLQETLFKSKALYKRERSNLRSSLLRFGTWSNEWGTPSDKSECIIYNCEETQFHLATALLDQTLFLQQDTDLKYSPKLCTKFSKSKED